MAQKINLFTDVIELLKDITPNSIGKNYTDNKRRQRKTLKERSGDFILQFPLVTSDTIDQDTVELMRNQLELERAFEFDYILTNSPLHTFDPKDPNSFMADLHNNINLSESTTNDIRRSNEYLLETPEEKFNMSSLNDMTITREEMKELVKEDIKIKDENDNIYSLSFSEVDYFKSQRDSNAKYDLELSVYYPDSKSTENYKFKDLNEKTKDKSISRILSGKTVVHDKKGQPFEGSPSLETSFNNDMKDFKENAKKDVNTNFGASVTIDKDKINSSLPTTITSDVNFIGTDSKGNYIEGVMVERKVKFGVKTVVHVVKTEDVIFYLSDKSRGSNLVTKLVKFTTGELRLVRDLFLDSEKVKKIAQDSKKGRSGSIWNKLNSLYTVNRTGSLVKSTKANYIPTTALMITIDEANEVKRKTGVDLLSDRRAVKKIYNEFFLLDFIIIDQARELVYKYLPDHNKFEVVKESKLGAYKVKNNQKDLTSEMLEKLLKR